MRGDKIVYKLVVADIQKVAEEMLDRRITDEEIVSISDSMADHIPWYDAIENAILEKILGSVTKVSSNFDV